jgi:hypothetical protein
MSDYSKPPEGGNGAGEYQPDDEVAEARLLRIAAQAEARWCRRVDDSVDRLLTSLTPADAALDLFTHREMSEWNLTRHRKRPTP